MNYQKKNNYSIYKTTAKPIPKRRLDKLFAMLAVVFLLAPFIYFIIYGYMEGKSVFLAFALTVFTLGLGYCIQIAAAKIFGFGQSRMDGSYENAEHMFTPLMATGAYIAAAALFIVTIPAVKAYLRWRAGAGLDPYYDKYAVIPFLLAAALAVFTAVGGIAWSFPAKWLISLRMLFTDLAITTVCFIITKYIYNVSILYLAVSTAAAVICAVISYLFTRYYESFMQTS